MPYPLEVDDSREARGAARGHLKVFFGATPGVGKTHAMLDAARIAHRGGIDMVVGFAVAHDRPELLALLEGLPRLPTPGPDLDLDAALARRPAVLVVDELAHANAAASRHRARWQDVLEVLEAGIDVWTTLNVTDLESLSDVVRQITRRPVGETVPDSVLERADEIELVDLAPESLHQRFKEEPGGLSRGDLLALRELALRRTAERIDADVQAYRRKHGIEETWPSSDRLIVCVGPGPHAARLVRAAYRMASGLRADWSAVYVETPAHAHLPQEDRDWVTQHLRLAEALGGRGVRLSGENVSAVLLGWAREHNVTRILVGKPTHPRWRDRLRGSLIDGLIRGSGDIEIHVSRGEAADAPHRPPRVPTARSPLASYLGGLAVVAGATGLAWIMTGRFQPWDLALVFLLATVIVATRFGRGPSILAATLGVAIFDFCFVPPYFSFTVHEDPYILTFVVMLVVGVTVSTLATRVRDQAEAARSHARWAATLHALSRELAEARDVDGVVASATRQIEAALGGGAAIFLPDDKPSEAEAGVVRWVREHGSAAGRGTDSFRDAPALYVPLRTAARTAGVLAFRATDSPLPHPEPREMLEAMAHQVAGALERTLVAEEARQTELRARTEELRNSLLSSVSHDLRTPLSAIMGSATTLLDDKVTPLAPLHSDLARAIHEEAERLSRLVTNLLAMTRVESRDLAVRKEWLPLEEIVGAALERLGTRLASHVVRSQVPDGLPLVPVDPVLMEQVLFNLLDNAVRHTAAGSTIEIRAAGGHGEVHVEIADNGAGLPHGLEARVFEKFARGPAAPAGGSGLGLAICRAVIVAHGGHIEAATRPEGGARFRFTIPIEGEPPVIPVEEAATIDKAGLAR